MKQVVTIVLLGCIYSQCTGQEKTTIIGATNKTTVDNSKKKILARGCDPELSAQFAKIAPSLTGNARYIPTSDDQEFIHRLKTEQWSVVYFAPGACRYSAAKHAIPGGNSKTRGWSLEEYKEFIYKYQGEDIQIVESVLESESIQELNKALAKARDVDY